jgi:Leucine-rich repeat (LRR) protein
MDVSNSKYLTETPKFFWTPKLERLDFTGCTNLTQVHPSIGHLTELVFLSLQNCSSLVNLDFGSVSNLNSLRVLRLSGCTKLQKTPEFTGASNLEYLDMDGCICLSTVHESIGVLAKLRFLSLRDCIVLAGMPNSINTMTSLVTLDLYGCLKLTTLPLGQKFSPPYMESLIFLDASFCNLHRLPDVIGELRCLERLSLQGNNFTSLPPNFSKLGSLAYLNLAHCHELQTFPRISSQKKRSLVGGYFKIASGSRDHRSGLHVFDCPKLKFTLLDNHEYFSDLLCKWLERLLKVSTLHNIPLSRFDICVFFL